MTFESLRQVIRAQPFHAFTLRLADGRSMHVRHPEFVGFVGDRRTLMVSFPGKPEFELIDLVLINSVEIGLGRNGRGRERKSA
jgi:hypothetical protein